MKNIFHHVVAVISVEEKILEGFLNTYDMYLYDPVDYIFIENYINAGISNIITDDKDFQSDGEGASLHNASFNLYGSSGGRIDLSAAFGIVGGANQNILFAYDSKGQPTGIKTVNGNVITKIRSLPSGDTPNANFWLDMDGDSYFKGMLHATSGRIGGWNIADSYLYSGSGSNRVALNGGTSYYSPYAIWAGAENPANAKFWVKKDGSIYAKDGTFSGTLSAAKVSGALMAANSDSWLEGCGIRVGKNYSATKNYNFYVDPNGNVWIQGNLTLSNGVITWDNLNSNVGSQIDNKISSGITASENGIKMYVQETANGLTESISAVNVRANNIEASVQTANNEISAINLWKSGLRLSVSNGYSSSYIALTSGSTTISSGNIEFNGVVTFNGLENGTTTIDGACIKTGTIDANRLNLTGAITFSDLSSGMKTDFEDVWDTANAAQSTANKAKNAAADAQALADETNNMVSGWCYKGTTYIDGSMIQTGTVMASKLKGGEIKLLDYRGRDAATIFISETSTGNGIELTSHSGGIRITPSGYFWVSTYAGEFGINSMGLACKAHFVPTSDGSYFLGTEDRRWNRAYISNGVINTSDRNKKREIDYDMKRFDKVFDSLRPCSFLKIDDSSGKRHQGLIAQDVLEAVESAGLTTQDFAAYCGWTTNSGETGCGLIYEEFIAMLIYETQKLKTEVKQLKGVIYGAMSLSLIYCQIPL